MREAACVDANRAGTDIRHIVLIADRAGRFRLEIVIDVADDVGLAGVRVDIDGNAAVFVVLRHLLELAVIESGHANGMCRLPNGNMLSVFVFARHFVADGDDLILGWEAEGEVEARGIVEHAGIRIPARARADGVVPIAGVLERFFSFVCRLQQVLLSRLHWLRQHDCGVAVFFRFFLNPRQRSP